METGRLFHAYGLAGDTAVHLAALTGDDPAGRAGAVRHLWSALLHQGTPGTATPVAVEHLLTLLGRPGLEPSLRAELLDFLEAVATQGARPDVPRGDLKAMVRAQPDIETRVQDLYAAGREDELYEDPDLTGAMLALATLRCRDVQPAVIDVVTRLEDDPEVGALARSVTAAARQAVDR